MNVSEDKFLPLTRREYFWGAGGLQPPIDQTRDVLVQTLTAQFETSTEVNAMLFVWGFFLMLAVV